MTDMYNQKVMVAGDFNLEKLLKILKKKTSKKAEILMKTEKYDMVQTGDDEPGIIQKEDNESDRVQKENDEPEIVSEKNEESDIVQKEKKNPEINEENDKPR